MIRYTPHDCLHRLSEEMELFDEGTGLQEKGGDKKEVFLHTRHSEISFTDRPHLNKLIEELSQHFSTRYAKPIPSTLRKMLEAMALTPDNPLMFERNLKVKLWLVKTIRKHLEQRDWWPKDDAASRNADTSQATARQKILRDSATSRRDVGSSSLKRRL